MGKKQKIIVGMTGGIGSVVTAYLLKKQGYDCIAVSVILVPEIQASNSTVFCGCHIRNLDHVKKICEFLEIPFYAVNAIDEYKDQVIDFVVANVIKGETFFPCASCNNLKIKILLEKASKLGAKMVATGHYARINQNRKTNESYLVTANDIEHDQTYELTRMNSNFSSQLIFPLADMLHFEVEKIAKSLKLELIFKESEKKKICFLKNDMLPEFIVRQAPRTLLSVGNIFEHNDSENYFLMEHEGIHNYHVGQVRIMGNGPDIIEHSMQITKIVSETKNIYLEPINTLRFDYCSLDRFDGGREMDISRSMRIFIKLGINANIISGTIHFKNNESVLLEFDQIQIEMIVPGQLVVIYDKNGTGARVIGSGYAGEMGEFSLIKRVPKQKDKTDYLSEEDDVGKNEDFKF